MISATGTQQEWKGAIQAMLCRIKQTATVLEGGFPHWANGETGVWTTTPDGDWTGGAWPGMLWLAHRVTGEARFLELARTWCVRLRPRATRDTAFKGFGFYCGAALGEMLSGDDTAKTIGLEAAASLVGQFDPQLGLIPLGREAEEHGEIGKAFSSIDSLQAVPLLQWAARRTGDDKYRRVAISHTTRVLDIHCRWDGSVVQSSELNSENGYVLRHFTHKGYADDSVWGRAQGWGMLYSAMAVAQYPNEGRWLKQSMASADWWLAHVPADQVAYWDFNDPQIPATHRDTAATAIVSAALLKLGDLAPTAELRARYRSAAEATVRALISDYLVPTNTADLRQRGMLIGGCFNKRSDSRQHDAAQNAELIFGSYFLFACLQVLVGAVDAADI